MEQDLQNTRMLVVEDDGLIRLDMVCTLEDMGFGVIEAANADQALLLLERDDIGVLLTDIDMPGSMNGLVLARIVHGRWPNRKIVVISGRYEPEQGTLPPGARFVVKPVTERHLEAVLKEIGAWNR